MVYVNAEALHREKNNPNITYIAIINILPE